MLLIVCLSLFVLLFVCLSLFVLLFVCLSLFVLLIVHPDLRGVWLNLGKSRSPPAAFLPPMQPCLQVVRTSKFRHVRGKGTKAEETFFDLRLSQVTTTECNLIQANQLFFCIPYAGAAGHLAIFPLDHPGKTPVEWPTFHHRFAWLSMRSRVCVACACVGGLARRERECKKRNPISGC